MPLYQKARIIKNKDARFMDDDETRVLDGLEVWVLAEAPKTEKTEGPLTGRKSIGSVYTLHSKSAELIKERLGMDHAPDGLDQEAIELLAEFKEFDK